MVVLLMEKGWELQYISLDVNIDVKVVIILNHGILILVLRCLGWGYKKNNFNVTYSGDDPLYQNLDDLVSLSKRIHGIGLDIWLYTGFVFEELLEDLKYKDILDNVDVIVDGPFIEEKKDLNLLFMGSSNQRILKKINGNFVEVKY